MKERPILFSAPMVRALLAGTKTQTRRLVKTVNDTLTPQQSADWKYFTGPDAWRLEFENRAFGFAEFRPVGQHGSGIKFSRDCPYGVPGDRLWVREAWCHTGVGVWTIADARLAGGSVIYRADGERHGVKWWPSIHMPREFSRITLEVVAVRVERLQDISEADAKAEGLSVPNCKMGWGVDGEILSGTPSGAYRVLWEQINGPGSWDANPWVWVVEFKRAEAPIVDKERLK